MRILLLFCTCFFCLLSQAQEINGNYRKLKTTTSTNIQLDTVPINNTYFKLTDKEGNPINKANYTIDFATAKLTLTDSLTQQLDSVYISFLRYPDFLTKSYSAIDPAVIVNNTNGLQKLYALQEPVKKEIQLFDGLQTSGSISRGVTIGNNQSAVLNSQLDLQISGKLANDIVLRASIKDDNIPIQENGYSQRAQEFDQIYIEVESSTWGIRAGDVHLQNAETYFMNFNKKIQGIAINANLTPNKDSRTEAFISGGIVRGRYTNTNFNGEEGNQGPYKLTGSNGELYVLIVSGSERVYVNGILLERGENNDYVIDYGAGEVLFTSKYPITSDTRIKIEYQYTDYNYSRYVVYGGAKHQSEKLSLNTYIYTESDAKNRPVQQNLSEDQVNVLQNAGDDTSLMNASSAIAAAYDENRIQYTQTMINGTPVFVYSNVESDELYNVTFTSVGSNQGNYVLAETLANGNIYSYVMPVNGIPQGNYEPVVTLTPPTQTQIAVVNGSYTPTEKTTVNFEGAISNNDNNLYSTIDDGNNKGLAAKLGIKQQLLNTNSKVTVFANYDFIHENFKSIERVYNIEFNRDWNLETTPIATQQLLSSGISFNNNKKGNATYQFEYLDFKDYQHASRHSVSANLTFGKLRYTTHSNFLTGKGVINTSTFARSYNTATYGFTNYWLGTRINYEFNKQREIATQQLTNLSQSYREATAFTGVGDSTNLFAEVGYKYRINDSIKANQLTKYNTSHTYYLNSQLIKNNNTQLSAYVNYRKFTYEDADLEDENSLNSRIVYYQKLWKGLVQLNTTYENNSGTIAQQEFGYVEVDAGQGSYTWNDYNNNGIQELDEFEIAQFQDEATFVRVLLPNRIYLKTHQNKFSQNITLNPGLWSNSDGGFKKIISHFYNQFSYATDRKVERNNKNFNLNPFGGINDESLLGLNETYSNTLIYNRGKQHYTTAYTYLSTKVKTLLAIGSLSNHITSHQLQFNHQLNELWLFNLGSNSTQTKSESENYESRNYTLTAFEITPKLSYFFSNSSKVDVYYSYTDKSNKIGNQETLEQHQFGLNFNYAYQQKIALTGEINYYKNTFEGNTNSAVGYQMLEGLKNGNNFTWSLLAQKQLTKFLDLNINYFGRQGENSKTIHTGTIQLKAYF